MCKTVTIIIKAVIEIKVFFFIFAASIIAFTHTFLHLLWARIGADIVNKETGELEINHHDSADYPSNPLMAFSATYFFMVMICNYFFFILWFRDICAV